MFKEIFTVGARFINWQRQRLIFHYSILEVQIGIEEKISALIIKRARAILRITQRNSKSFSVNSFEVPKLSRVRSKPKNVRPHPLYGLWIKIS
jgi:hypothetical protein